VVLHGSAWVRRVRYGVGEGRVCLHTCYSPYTLVRVGLRIGCTPLGMTPVIVQLDADEMVPIVMNKVGTQEAILTGRMDVSAKGVASWGWQIRPDVKK
jgi:hypothetical protein